MGNRDSGESISNFTNQTHNNGLVLVTGANGLLGAHVVRALLNHGYKVRAMVRKGCNLSALNNLNYELFEGQITISEDIEKAVNKCEFVIHVAARTAQSPSSLEPYLKPNTESTKYLMESCQKNDVKRLVFVSTANCFSNGTLENPGNEKSPFMPWLKKSGYAYSKYLAQKMVLEETEKNTIDAVIVNPTFIIGENDVKPSSGQIFFHVVNKKVVFYPTGGKNFVDAHTAADGVLRALKAGVSGECYLLAGENHTYLQFFKLISNYTGQKPIFIPIPCFILKIAGRIGDVVERVFKKSVRLSYVNAKMLCLENYFTADKAINELGFRITPVKVSIEKALLWFQKNNYF